jgi:hypothetical protein
VWDTPGQQQGSTLLPFMQACCAFVAQAPREARMDEGGDGGLPTMLPVNTLVASCIRRKVPWCA